MLRTGTNFLSALIEKNYRVRALSAAKGGWKHGPFSPEPDITPILITKSPFTWLVSFYDWEVLSDRTRVPFSTFVTSPVTHPRLAATWKGTDPIDTWNRATRCWLEAVFRHGLSLVRYEDLIADFASELRRLQAHHGWRPRHADVADITDRVDTWPTPRPRKPLDRSFYLTGSTERIDSSLLELITQRLDRESLVALRYADPS